MEAILYSKGKRMRVRKESEKGIDEIDDDRSDYERQIDVRRHDNEVIKHQLGLVSLLFVLKISSLVRLQSFYLPLTFYHITFISFS